MEQIKLEVGDMPSLTEQESQVLNLLVDYILNQAKEWRDQFNEKSNYPRWTTTWLLSVSSKQKASYLRPLLSSLEKKGYVEAERRPNHISWSPKSIPGFKRHHQFRDYMEPSNDLVREVTPQNKQ